MTPRNVLAVDFNEIKAVEVRCKCGAVTSLPFRKDAFSIEHFACIGCNSTLWFKDADGNPYKKVKALIDAISAWQSVEGALFTLGFSLETSGRASDAKGFEV
jgi:hypothetical protein